MVSRLIGFEKYKFYFEAFIFIKKWGLSLFTRTYFAVYPGWLQQKSL